jgi:thiol-disulfide isomerase/thioredoxin
VSGFLAALAAIVWLHDEAKAMRQSRATGKPMLIDFRADWCSACKMLDKHTWADPAVQSEIKARFVPLSLDVSHESAATDRLAKRYEVAGLPTILIVVCKVATPGAGCTLPREGQGRFTGYVPPSEMIRVAESSAMRSVRFLAIAAVALLCGAAEMPEHATRLSPPPALVKSALRIGDKAPPFELPVAGIGTFVLSEARRQGAVVVVFYRGSW